MGHSETVWRAQPENLKLSRGIPVMGEENYGNRRGGHWASKDVQSSNKLHIQRITKDMFENYDHK